MRASHRVLSPKGLALLLLGLSSSNLAWSGPASARGLASAPRAALAPGPAWALGPDEEGRIGNSTPLPSNRTAEAAIARGDAAYEEARGAQGRDRVGRLNAAFDAWRAALDGSPTRAGVRLRPSDLAGGTAALFPDPDETHARRSEGVTEAIQRRLASLSTDERDAWAARFQTLAENALADVRSGHAAGAINPREASAALSAIERGFPFTRAAAVSALSLTDLELEAGRPGAAATWLNRADRHLEWKGRAAGTTDASSALLGALRLRAAAVMEARSNRGRGDHSDFSRSPAPAPKPGERRPGKSAGQGQAPGIAEGPGTDVPLPVTTQRITGLIRRSDEPFGLGLTSGAAFLRDGTTVIQGAHGVVTLTPTEDGEGFSLGFTGAQRSQYSELFDIRQPIGRAAPSSGGWPSLPATDGDRVALVMGRGEPRRNFRDVEIASAGNYLALCAQGPANRPLSPLWIVKDGLIADDPAGRGRKRKRDEGRALPFGGITDAFSRSGRPQPGWDLGSGWEFQPGPVFRDGRVFVLARGLGGSTEDSGANQSDGQVAGDTEDRADELRLLALDASSAALLWSVSVTRERGLLAGSGRGEGGYYAVTAMPLGFDPETGSILVGSNSGLIAAYGAAEGRLLWALRNQRRGADEPGWPGSQPPRQVASSTAWFTPFDSSCAYALPAGPAPLDGSLFREAPRQKGDAIALAAALPPAGKAGPRGGAERSTLVLMGRYGRHAALLIDEPGQPREPAAYLAPGDHFAGTAALDPAANRLWVAGARELSGFTRSSDFSLEQAAPIPSQGAGTGGDVVLHRNFLYVLGRDTVWVYRAPND